MIDKELIHRRNSILFILISAFYLIHVTINSFIEGLASIFPPAFLFIIFGIILIQLIHKKVNPKITMYVMISFIYIYFYFLLNDSPYLVNYLFMWMALPLSAIYENSRVIVVAGVASIILTFYSFFYLHHEIFSNVGREDFIYLVLFGVFNTFYLFAFIHKARETNAKLQELAFHDPLTGAANRLLLKEKFNLLKRAKVHSIAILFIDMNGFKKINDTYGHEVGDQLLKEMVARVSGLLRDTDLLCRLGGDEFAILSSNIDNPILEKISRRIQFALEKPVVLNHQIINLSASIGWYYTTEVLNVDLEELIKEADRAMYRAKRCELIAGHSSDLQGKYN
ncbi:diguanylate cyclase domain-containing protein [Niallia sp. Krafla_26]|uniref:diguanylate cyclase domain-containing protein n=1 Tax=Niallia sp. Krafla_26 TaxID=3064703 RepID=UPI003D17537D